MNDQILEALEIGLDSAIEERSIILFSRYRRARISCAEANENILKIEAAIALYKSQKGDAS